ncbi:unnamed protein product [Adineta ricciae]|uniref:Uncharacterized protein n=1 Tax=Adineta ricciae TaxID=249248 RepID=A0A816DFX8_ADIRI|nr:unnamed protein product [Adineta ricciae]CAF1634298.1 unnamed protein product [Adineta ricciae]
MICGSQKKQVIRWPLRSHTCGTQGTTVAGGKGRGDRLNQLDHPYYVCVDQNYAIYVSDNKNDGVMKWSEAASEGTVVAGFRGQGNDLTQRSDPLGVIVDGVGNVYVADAGNVRVVRWNKGTV